MLLALLGIATGLSALNSGINEAGNGTGPLLWAGICTLIAAFVAGYVAARASGLKRKSDGLLHGITAWAVATLLFVMLAAAAGGSLLGGIFGSMSEVASQAGAAANTTNGTAGSVLARQFGNVDPGLLEQFEERIASGNRSEAIQLLIGALNMDPQRAARIVDQALLVAGTPPAASTAERGTRIASSAAWMVFGAMALSLALSMSGGLLGASGARRLAWSGNALPQTA
jgi:hypothetical protein